MAESKPTTPALIPVQSGLIGTATIATVNARDLHAFLGVRQRFNDWIVKRIGQYGFSEDVDFTRYCDSSSGNPNPLVHYFVSLDMAKELSMVERTKKGKEARQYFLECERAAERLAAVPTLHDPVAQALMQVLMDHDKTKYELAQVKEQAQRTEDKLDAVVNNQNFWTIAEYVQYHGLRRQCPESAYVEASRHLQSYCKRERLNYRDPNILPRRIPVGEKAWETEWGFHTSVYEAAFLPWLTRRGSQVQLVHMEHQRHNR